MKLVKLFNVVEFPMQWAKPNFTLFDLFVGDPAKG